MRVDLIVSICAITSVAAGRTLRLGSIRTLRKEEPRLSRTSMVMLLPLIRILTKAASAERAESPNPAASKPRRAVSVRSSTTN